MIFRIINPSDKYTLEAKEFCIAAVTVAILGRGQFGLESEDETMSMPPLMFGDPNEWFIETFGKDFETIFKGHRAEVKECLESVVIGSFGDRKLYFSTLEKITEQKKREEFMSEWLDTHRSSTNNIGAHARDLAKVLEKDLGTFRDEVNKGQQIVFEG